MIIANVHQAKSDLSKLIAATLAGKSVFVAKNGTPVVKLVQVKNDQILNSYGKFKGKMFISDDFNDEDPKINKMFYGE